MMSVEPGPRVGRGHLMPDHLTMATEPWLHPDPDSLISALLIIVSITAMLGPITNITPMSELSEEHNLRVTDC